uniref:J domain-containing protein n=1 Tax=Davidia involucrata TaxID=16924 RepID=A0A5B7AGA1_DAVIN
MYTVQELYHILGIGGICKAYKSLVSKCHPEKNPSPKKDETQDKFKSIHEAQIDIEASKALNNKNQEEKIRNGVHDLRSNAEEMRCDNSTSPRCFYRHVSINGYTTTIPSPLSRSTSLSRLSRRSGHGSPSLSRSGSRRTRTPTRAAAPVSQLSRSASCRRSSATIMYSNSNGVMKPPAMEKQLECTLEELCFGCIKKINITRDVITNNGFVTISIHFTF